MLKNSKKKSKLKIVCTVNRAQKGIEARGGKLLCIGLLNECNLLE